MPRNPFLDQVPVQEFPLTSYYLQSKLKEASISSSYALTASYAETASFASTASFALTASFINTASTNAFMQGGNSFGAQALLGTNDNQNLAFETSGSVRMFISSSGNVGIGTTSPTTGLDVSGSGRFTNGLTVTGSLIAPSITGSLQGTASWANNATSASYAATASYVSPYETAWETYTPLWTSNGDTDPDIGDGGIQGYYKLIGKTCFVRGSVNMGSTTTFGKNEWLISLPFTASSTDMVQMCASLYDSQNNFWYNAQLNNAVLGFRNRAVIQYQDYPLTATAISENTPFTWKDGNKFIWNGTYEIS